MSQKLVLIYNICETFFCVIINRIINCNFRNYMSQPHQHGPQCRHGHGHGGQGGHGHSHGHGGHGGHGENSMPPKEYFQKFSIMKQKNPELYWMQILNGNWFNKYCEDKGWDFIRAISCQVVTMVVAQAQMMFACQWLPLWSRAFFSGLFFPLVFLLIFNFNVVYGVTGLDFTAVHLFSYLTILFYILAAIRSPGAVNLQEGASKTKQALRERPYLESPMLTCSQCKILKLFRAVHCPMCKVCITKFSRHSLAFGTCIGSTNQLLAWVFFCCLTIAEFLTILAFFNQSSYGVLTNIMFYVLNVYIFWISFVETSTIFVMNFCFGVTEHEARMWMMCQYLMKIPQRQFCNSVGKGLINNIIESIYALLGIAAYESKVRVVIDNPLQQQMPISGQSSFQKLQSGKTYIVNWNKAFFYVIPQIPSHPCRENVIEMMKKDEPRMIQMFRLQQKFKQEISKETEGQGLNEFQIQQRVAMKMQQHMMRNSQQMMSTPHQSSQQQMMANPMQQSAPQQPSPEQQKIIQIQMLGHMIGQLQQRDPQSCSKLKDLLQGLKSDNITPMQVGIAMRQIQQQMMKKQMQAVMRQRQQIERNRQMQAQKQQQRRKDEDEEEQLKKQQVADEDL